MSFSKTWDEAVPDGATANANDIDLFIKDTKIAVRERLTSITGVAAGNFNTDPFDPSKYGPNVTITGKNVHPTIYDNGTVIAGSITVNYSNGNKQKLALGGNTTISMTSGTVDGQYVVLYVKYNGTYTTSWGSSVKHTKNTTPSPSVSNNTWTVYFLEWIGSIWICTMTNTGVPTS